MEEHLSHRSDNLESLFITTKIGGETHTIGVVYQPPSGDRAMFLIELEAIIKKCSLINLQIFGDFNINLHKLNDGTVKEFEDLILSNGLFPLISIPTHARPGCQQSCIDNIFTSNISTVMTSGTVELGISHHFSIFQLSEIDHGEEEKVSTVQYYDFSNSKTELFLENIKKTFENSNERLSLEKFIAIYDEQIDNVFKLKTPKKS